MKWINTPKDLNLKLNKESRKYNKEFEGVKPQCGPGLVAGGAVACKVSGMLCGSLCVIYLG